MDLSFTPEDSAFQQEVRSWIAEAYTPELQAKMAMSKNGYLDKEGQVAWQRKLNDRGWVAPNWPEEHGGPGLSPSERYILNMELSAAGTPTVSPMGLSMVAPVIMAFGSEEQKKQHLPPILASEVWWCQGYSEPGSGSDLASLQMSAERDGDDYILNGSKIWTTLPGISVSPLPTLDMPVEGQQEVNQVFFENVRVPIEGALVGKENEGWTYAKYLLQFERGNSYAPGLRNMLKKAKKIASAEQANGDALIRDADFARKVAGLELKIDSLDATERRIFSSLSAGQAVGPESSMLKCQGSETQQEITELLLEAVGSYGVPFVQDSLAIARQGANADLPMPHYAVPVAPSYFNYRKTSIYAGSNEIQRNIMAKMVLGL